MRSERVEPEAGQESVWDYPRPPRVKEPSRHIRVMFNGVTIAETRHARRVVETSHPPVCYVPTEDVRMAYLGETLGSSWCEWKGRARYYSVIVDGTRVERAARAHSQPQEGFEAIEDHVAFYAGAIDVCTAGRERLTPQPGGFYGGWITGDVASPFKGGLASWGW